MSVFAREFFGVGTAVRVWGAIGVAFKGDCGHCDDWTFGKSLFKVVIFPLAFSQADALPVIMDDDTDMIRVIEGRCAAVERSVIEIPFWRSEAPDELVEIMTVFVVACAAAFSRKIKLVPPFEFGLWRQRHLIGFRVADQIAAHGDERLAAFGPERRQDVGCPRCAVQVPHCRALY